MARSARKPKTSSRSRSASRKTSRTPSSRTSTRKSSTAKSVRGRSSKSSSSRASRSRSTASSRRSTSAKKSTRTTVTRTRRRNKKTAQTSSFWSSLTGTVKATVLLLLGVVVLFFVVWFFILPSVLLQADPSKNILYVSDDINSLEGKIIFAHIDENSDDSQLFLLSGAEVVEVPNGYGKYAVGTVPSLLAMDNQSPEMITSIMSRILEVPIDTVIMDTPLTLTDTNSVFSSQQIAQQLQAVAFENGTSPSRFLTLLQLSLAARRTEDLSLNSYQDAGRLVSTSSVVLTPAEKECSVAVINATGVSQLARNTAELLEKNGVYVIREDSVSEEADTTMLELSDQLSPECASMLEKITPFFPVGTESTLQSEESQRYRSDIVIFLGKDVVTSTPSEE